MSTNDTAVIEALKEAHETIEWAMNNLNCNDPLVETWANSYMHAMSLLERELRQRGVELQPTHNDPDLPF